MRERIPELDFIRAVCTLGIVAFHFACYVSEGVPRFLYVIGQMGWGEEFVAVFFILSGFALQYNNRNTGKVYFWKRFKSIYPMFYITFLIFFIRSVFENGSVFYLGAPWKMLLSITALDGFFYYRCINYYQVGEWFLGAIVILYLIYPLLNYAVARPKARRAVSVLLALLYAATVYSYQALGLWEIAPTSNLIPAVCLFWTGMLLSMHREKIFAKPYLYAAAGVLLMLAGFLGCGYVILCECFFGAGLFLVLWFLGRYAMEIGPLNYISKGTAGLSYAIFLIHHRVLKDAALWLAKVDGLVSYFVLLICLTAVIYMAAWVIKQAGGALCRSTLMLAAEKHIL